MKLSAMKNVPWPLRMLAGFFVLCLLASGVVRLALEGASGPALLEWAASGTLLAAIGYLSVRWLNRTRRPFGERWAGHTGRIDVRSRD